MATTPPAKKTTAAKAAASPAPPTPAEQAALDEQEREQVATAAEEQAKAEQQRQEEAREEASKGRAEVKREADTTEERKAADRVCVVSDGSPHTGYALPGKRICSAHEMHYYPDGTPRIKVHAAEQKAAQQPSVGVRADEGM